MTMDPDVSCLNQSQFLVVHVPVQYRSHVLKHRLDQLASEGVPQGDVNALLPPVRSAATVLQVRENRVW